jgi:hypothetical protein
LKPDVIGCLTGNKAVFISMSILICSLIADIAIIRIYYISFNTNVNEIGWRILSFIAVCTVSIVCQYIALTFAKNNSHEVRSKDKSFFNPLYRLVLIVQTGLNIIVLILILQIVIASVYNVALLFAVISISYTLAIIIMSLLAIRLLNWFKSNRNFVLLALYGLSSLAFVINALFTLCLVLFVLASQPSSVIPHSSLVDTFFVSDPLTVILNYGYNLSSIISFIVLWSATAVLLHHFSQKLGKAKYWLILSIPLVYFLAQFSPFLSLFPAFIQSQSLSFGIIYTLIFSLSKPFGGILFGIAFWTISKGIRSSDIVRTYMIISAYGFVLLFVSNQAIVLVSSSYPPFGVATISFLGLSSYLVLVGIYSSAISVSNDINLRRSIKKFALGETKLLDSIGTAHMEQEIENRVLNIAKEQKETLVQETGVQSSLDEDDIKRYLEEIQDELLKRKEQR